jgi:hypothetical protein
LSEAQKRFHKFECNVEVEALRKFYQQKEFGPIDPLMSLRMVTEPLMMAGGSVKRLRELMALKSEENCFDFDLSHENDESMDTKRLKILSILQGIWTEKQLKENRSINQPLKLIYKKLFPNKEDFKFMVDFSVCFMSTKICNSVSIYAAATSDAIGILAFGSFFNHSCDPNVTYVGNFGSKIALIVIKPVKKGEQLFLNFS